MQVETSCAAGAPLRMKTSFQRIPLVNSSARTQTGLAGATPMFRIYPSKVRFFLVYEVFTGSGNNPGYVLECMSILNKTIVIYLNQ